MSCMAVEAKQRFGRWEVIDPLFTKTYNSRSGKVRTVRAPLCMCECGTVRAVYEPNLGRTQHGLSGGRHYLYATWNAMMARCYNERCDSYPDYGGRGITVQESWHSPKVFIRWVEENLGQRPEGYSFDRRNNDGNYEEGNVRWADKSTQQRNKRTIRQLQARIAELERELVRGGDAGMLDHSHDSGSK